MWVFSLNLFRGKFLLRQPDAEKIQFDSQSQTPPPSRSPSALSPQAGPGPSTLAQRARTIVPYIDVSIIRKGGSTSKKLEKTKVVHEIEEEEEIEVSPFENNPWNDNNNGGEFDMGDMGGGPEDFDMLDLEGQGGGGGGGDGEEDEKEDEGSLPPTKADKGKGRQMSSVSNASREDSGRRPLVNLGAQGRSSGLTSTKEKGGKSKVPLVVIDDDDEFEEVSDEDDESKKRREETKEKARMAASKKRAGREESSSDDDARERAEKKARKGEKEKKKRRREEAIKIAQKEKEKARKKSKGAASFDSDDSSASSSESDSKKPRNLYRTGRNKPGARIPWSSKEEKLLLEELELYSTSWATMIARHGKNGSISHVFKYRNPVQLKDKARNIKIASIKANRRLDACFDASTPFSLFSVVIPNASLH